MSASRSKRPSEADLTWARTRIGNALKAWRKAKDGDTPAESRSADTHADANADPAVAEPGERADGLDVSQPDEPAEMEADAVADQVADTMHGEEATAAPQPKITANLDGVGRKIHLAEDENAKNPADASIKRLGNDGQDGAALKDSLKQIQHERAACLEELSILEQSVEKLGLGEQRTEEVKRSIGRGKNALEEHLTDADITGAMRDVAGDPVRQPGSGRIFDHQQEVNDSLRALQSTRRELLRVRTELERRQFDPTTIAEVLQAPIESLQRVIETVRQALRKVQP